MRSIASRWRFRLWQLQTLEIGDGFAGLGGRGEDGAVIVLQEPLRQIEPVRAT
jgi:hypothetical protein